jgi:hypothetical protein
MAKNKKPTDDLRTVTRTRMADIPADPAGARIDYGDAAQRAEMDGFDELTPAEPIGVVDAPAQLREPVSRADKQRNQRRLTT